MTEIRTKTTEVLDELSQVGKIMILRRSKVEGYLLSADEYEQLVAAFEALRDLRAGKTRDYREVAEDLGF
ncbi:MAG: type II toxin-antitoxin system Phd/YefM family antitoxin [Anaerolineales bacterium]|nr:type II toxin-antitoxin system Phd/YefM family antitoxin [Anaerolineales bacterium]